MEELLQRLMSRLERIAETHEEIYDTDVREQMSEAIFDGFIRPTSNFTLPNEFGMFSAEGNRLVKEAVAAYIPAANARAAALGLTSFRSRLDAFQNDNVQTESGQLPDEFFGWADPAGFDENGGDVH